MSYINLLKNGIESRDILKFNVGLDDETDPMTVAAVRDDGHLIMQGTNHTWYYLMNDEVSEINVFSRNENNELDHEVRVKNIALIGTQYTPDDLNQTAPTFEELLGGD